MLAMTHNPTTECDLKRPVDDLSDSGNASHFTFDVAMDHLAVFDFVSKSVAESWFHDEYLLGDSSRAAYRDIGVMLLVRGAYWYVVGSPDKGTTKFRHAGCCYADIEDGELTFTGVRLYTDPNIGQFPLWPWRSEVSKIIRGGDPSSNQRRIVFLYKLYNPSQGSAKTVHDQLNTFTSLDKSDWEKWLTPLFSDPNRILEIDATDITLVRKLLKTLHRFGRALDDEGNEADTEQACKLKIDLVTKAPPYDEKLLALFGDYGTLATAHDPATTTGPPCSGVPPIPSPPSPTTGSSLVGAGSKPGTLPPSAALAPSASMGQVVFRRIAPE
jgi:hypothetical protein